MSSKRTKGKKKKKTTKRISCKDVEDILDVECNPDWMSVKYFVRIKKQKKLSWIKDMEIEEEDLYSDEWSEKIEKIPGYNFINHQQIANRMEDQRGLYCHMDVVVDVNDEHDYWRVPLELPCTRFYGYKIKQIVSTAFDMAGKVEKLVKVEQVHFVLSIFHHAN